MAKNNLAGLAALGALGMMMSKGKKTEVEDRFGPGAGIPYDYGGSGDSEVETFPNQLPSDRKENFSNEGRSGYVKPPVSAPKVRSSSPKIGGYTSDAEQIASANVPPPSDRVRRIAELGGVKMNPRIQRDELGEPLYKKKGGVIKMAKGGMTSSASRRADGIASKGKTRGKIC
jgi:hypothetical protein